MVQAAGKRIAMNTPVQGTAADIIKAAMVRVWQRLKKEVPEAKLILQIHDELVFETPEAELAALTELVRETMENAMQLKVPLVVGAQSGPNLGKA